MHVGNSDHRFPDHLRCAAGENARRTDPNHRTGKTVPAPWETSNVIGNGGRMVEGTAGRPVVGRMNARDNEQGYDRD
jgi:hypothetical protein